MSIIRHPQRSNTITLAYSILLLACGIASAKMIYDLRTEQNGASNPTDNTVLTAPDGHKDAGEAQSSEALALDPDIERRIHEILQGADTENSSEAPQSLADSVPVANPGVDPGPVVTRTAPQIAPMAPIRQRTPLHDQMVTPGNFEYLGAFRPPIVHDMDSKFSYGGWAVAYRDGGDPDGPDDGFPGSIFIVGHRNEELVAEIAIPRPAISERKSLDDLPVCEVLQPFADITSGIRTKMTNGSSEPFMIGGLQVLDNKLHWTIYKYYNVEGYDYYSHGVSSLNLRRPNARGPWHLGPFNTGQSAWHSYKNAGYVFDIPEPIATQYFGGRNLISGLQISTGLQQSSQGPAFYAYKTPYPAPPGGTDIDAVPMTWYPVDDPIPGHHYADRWRGAAWVTVGNKHTIVVVGRKAHGEIYYGLPRPGDCYDDKGYHGSSYEAQALFYTPNQLLDGSRMSVPNTPPALRWDSQTPGGSLNRFLFQDCGKEIGGVTYDRARNLLYIVEIAAGYAKENEWELLPIVHIMRLVAE
jgi:hypothetical protein